MYLKNYFYENMKLQYYEHVFFYNESTVVTGSRYDHFFLTSLLYPRLIIRTDPKWADGRGLLLIPLASISLLVFLFSLPLVIPASKIKKKMGGASFFYFVKRKMSAARKSGRGDLEYGFIFRLSR